jgi:hypothetical protein
VTVNTTSVYEFISVTCFDLTVGHHQVLQIVYNIMRIHNTLSESISQCYNVFIMYMTGLVYRKTIVERVNSKYIPSVDDGKVGDSLG